MHMPEASVKAESLTSQEARQRAQVLPVSAHNAGVIGMHGLAQLCTCMPEIQTQVLMFTEQIHLPTESPAQNLEGP